MKKSKVLAWTCIVVIIICVAGIAYNLGNLLGKALFSDTEIDTKLIIMDIDGNELVNQDIKLNDKQTVKDQLEKSGIQNDGSMGYVSTLYDIPSGENTFWVYEVNDKEVTVGYDKYELSDNDIVTWKYIIYTGE